MKQWVEFRNCVGKTISKQTLDGYDNDRWLIAFTDETWSSIEWGHPGYPEGEMRLQSEPPPLTEHVDGLLTLGLIDRDEADRLMEERKVKRDAEIEARERAELARLQAKYGKAES